MQIIVNAPYDADEKDVFELVETLNKMFEKYEHTTSIIVKDNDGNIVKRMINGVPISKLFYEAVQKDELHNNKKPTKPI